jgi:hypothetical protein
MANFITGIISITVSAVILASVFIATVKASNQSYNGVYCGNPNSTQYQCSWSTAEIAMWGLLTLIAIVGLLYGVLNVFGLA